MKPAHTLCALAVIPALAIGAAAHAQPADSLETLAIRSMNICLTAASGGNLHQLASAQGYDFYEGTYSRRIGDRWTFFQASPEPEYAGPQGYSCSMTVMRPKPQPGDPVTFTKRGPVFADTERVMERLTNGPLAFSNPYSVQYLRQRHPNRPGHQRTMLMRLNGNLVEVIYLEEGLSTFEMFYARGPKFGAITNDTTVETVTRPERIASLQEQITLQVRDEYCATRPIACQERWVQARDTSSSSSSSPGAGTRRDDDLSRHAEKLRNEGWWRNYQKYGRGKYD